MIQYIQKAAVMAEIENLLDKGKYHDDYNCAFRDGNNAALYALKGKIDTLEAKPIDFDKEYKDFIKCDNGRSMFETAKHFFELGVKVNKKEDV